MKNYSVKTILGIDFLNFSHQQTVEFILNYIHEGPNVQKEPIYIHTINTDHIVNAQYDEDFNDFLFNFPKVNTCDGFPLYVSSMILNARLPQRVTGADLVNDLLIKHSSTDLKAYIIGGDEFTIEQAKVNISTVGKRCSIVGYSCPNANDLFEENYIESVKKELRENDVNFLILALGSPKQEIWYKKSGIHEEFVNMITIGGASIDFIAEKVLRAPKIIREIGLEWLFRLVQEPKRLGKRYIKDLLFLKILFFELRNRRKQTWG